MTRRDYWRDPAAPKPTSRKPSASVLVTDNEGSVLLLRRTDTGQWTIPTGGLKKNETISQCATGKAGNMSAALTDGFYGPLRWTAASPSRLSRESESKSDLGWFRQPFRQTL